MNAFETAAGPGVDESVITVRPQVTEAGASEREAGEAGALAGHTRTPKGEQTRAIILETALDLFRERGYEETTMRVIAERAGVALGNAYYYFRSKEHLIQA